MSTHGAASKRAATSTLVLSSILVRTLVFPWGLWEMIGAFSRFVAGRFYGAGHARYRAWSRAGQTVLFIGLGIPATVFITGEILIRLNEWIVGEQPQYAVYNDVINLAVPKSIEIPGPKSVDPEPVPPMPREPYYNYLIRKYSPVIVQQLGYRPEWDIPMFLDFDGNPNPRDNVANELSHRPPTAGIHAEVTAETEDSYYILYSLYHVKDYDHPVRQMLSHWTFHDNDNEGFMIRVDKRSMAVEEAETWFHNRFFLANRDGVSYGDEPIQGRLYFENEHHPIIYAQCMGHGVAAFQAVDADQLTRNVKIIRWRGDRPAVPAQVNRRVQVDTTYDLTGFDDWYAFALGPLGQRGRGRGMFEEEIRLTMKSGVLHQMVVGRYIAGYDYAKRSWSRPKPPWSWDDVWDDIPVAIWHFLPSRAFESHFGRRLSHKYIYNRPIQKIWGMSAKEFESHVETEAKRRTTKKWKMRDEEEQVTSSDYWDLVYLQFKRYVNRLFRRLG